MRTVSVILLLLVASIGGAESPMLAITQPADVSDLVPVVEVRGTVADPSGALSWSIVGTDRGGDVRIGARGMFAFAVPTDGLHLTQSLRLVARDSYGRSAERVLMLVDREPGPDLTLEVPVDGSPRGAELAISGRVADPSGGPVGDTHASVSWSLPPTGKGGRLEVDEAGGFSTVIDCSGAGSVVLWLRAEDRFGHLTLCAVRLAAPQAAAAEPVAEETVAQTPVAAEKRAATGIEILSPEGTVWYRARVTIEGRLVDAEGIESLAWCVTGERGPSGETLVDSDGTFRLELATSELAGDRELEITADRSEAEPVRATLAMRDGRLPPAVRIDEPSVGGSYGSQLVLAGTVVDPYAGSADMGGSTP